MPELTDSDLEDFVEDASANVLAATQAAVRLYCGWHVCPVRVDVVTQVDDVAGDLLALPTMKLVELTSVTELGEPLDLAGLRWAIPTDLRPRRAIVSKVRGCWPTTYGAVTVTMTHGFTEDEAADWRRAVLSFADRMSLADSSGDPIQVGPFRWPDIEGLFNATECAVFDKYRLLAYP
jgi:hypothetical protein